MIRFKIFKKFNVKGRFWLLGVFTVSTIENEEKLVHILKETNGTYHDQFNGLLICKIAFEFFVDFNDI